MVAMLLEHGAPASSIGAGRWVLHPELAPMLSRAGASKAGFGKTVALLLEHGADPWAMDDNGRTPLDWLTRAAKSVDKEAVRRLLRPVPGR